MSEEDFKDFIPDVTIDRNAYEQGYNQVVLVIPSSVIPYKEQARLMDIREVADERDIKRELSSAQIPYWIQVMTDSTVPSYSSEKVSYGFEGYERGLNLMEGVHLYVQNKSLLNNLVINIMDTALPGGHMPSLCVWRGKAQIAVVCWPIVGKYPVSGGVVFRVLKESAS